MKTKVFACVMFIILLIMVISVNSSNGTPTDQLLLGNGEFEDYDSGFTNWTLGSYGSWATVSSPSINGNSCQLTTGAVLPMNSDLVSISQQVSGLPNTDYYVSVWVYIPNIENVSARLGVRFGNNDATDYIYSITNNGWEHFTYADTSRVDTDYISIGVDCYADENASAVFYVDSAILADEPIPEFTNGLVVFSILMMVIGLKVIFLKNKAKS